jgi:aminoglycoside 6-adenylyltransferase
MDEKTMLQRFIDWAGARADVRAVIMTSTRTTPGAAVDVFSDYDIILVTTESRRYQPDDWLSDFGPLLVLYRDPIQLIHGEESFARITQYENGLKIDFTIWTVELLRRFVAAAVQSGRLEPDYDLGYQVLLDKDGLTRGLPAPTYQAFIPARPDETTYYTVIEELLHEATYAAKYLWRDDLMAAKFILDGQMKGSDLRKLLEWYMQIDHGWSVRAGAYGRGIKRKLPPEIWAELEHTYVGPGIEENWAALFAVVGYLRRVQALVPGSARFPWENS